MSRRTKLAITALFLVLLAVPATYIALTWSPANALHFRLEHLAPPSRENPGADRKLRVSIENSSSAPIHFYGALMTRESSDAFLPVPRPGKNVVARDLLSGVVTPQLLKADTSLDAEYEILIPAFLMFDATVGDATIIPAHSTVHVAALLPRDYVNSTPPSDIFVHYHWETHTRVTARKVAEWLRRHTPSFADGILPRLSHRQDTSPLKSPPR